MFDSFLAHILVILLLLISSLRVFFIKDPRIDSATVVSPIAFFVSIANFFIWGLSVMNVILCALALLVFLTNVRAILRVSAELYVDSYSVAFIVATVIELLLTLFVGFLVVYFRPVRCVPVEFDAKKTIVNLSGNFTNGIHIQDNFLPESLRNANFDFSEYSSIEKVSSKVSGHKVSGIMNVYAPIEKIECISSGDSIFNKISGVEEKSEEELLLEKDAPILLFVGTPYADCDSYEPYFLFLAQKGFTILAADFYTSDASYFYDYRDSRFFRKFCFLRMMFNNPMEFSVLKDNQILENTKKGYAELSKIALDVYGGERKLFYITDNLKTDDIFSFTDKFAGSIEGIFQMDLIPEYKNVSLGFPEQTDLIFAYRKGIKRDDEFFIPRYVAFKTAQKLVRRNNKETKSEENK